eukprot:1403773-Prorocentrum_lima.AAC.1
MSRLRRRMAMPMAPSTWCTWSTCASRFALSRFEWSRARCSAPGSLCFGSCPRARPSGTPV